jgi:DNA-binding NtrC family response regulator
MLHHTVLVVDDEPLIRWSIGERLRAEGYTVLEAQDGRAATEQFGKGVDVVLIDSKLPGADGMTVLNRLLELDPAVRVILMTADTGSRAAVDAAQLGRFPTANKPFLLDEIVALVQEALRSGVFSHERVKLRTA